MVKYCWEIITPTHYRFSLRDNTERVFHDGSRLTAHDVKATYDAVLDPATAEPMYIRASEAERMAGRG